MRITVLMGGWTSEREISIKSGQNVASELRKLHHDVYELDVKKDLKYISNELYKSNPDFIFNALHGIGGEDGAIQGILEVFGIPYSNSGILGAAISFHKPTCKKLAKLAGVRIIDGFDLYKDEIEMINTVSGFNIDYPFIIKPASNGSTIGVFPIFNQQDLEKIKKIEWTFGNEIMIEKYIEGREFTTLVVDGQAVGSLEILCPNGFYDYKSKYDIGGSKHIANFELDEYTIKEMYEMSEAVFKACHCRSFARVDFRFDGKSMYFMEINTQPGMTETSLVQDIMKLSDLLKISINSPHLN